MSEPTYSMENPFQSKSGTDIESSTGIYEEANAMGKELLEKPLQGGGTDRILVQHSKSRMTVWERIKVLTESEPNILYQNWGKNLDGASLVTGILNINGRDAAVYGHDFTLRAGSMDATNGSKLARLIYTAGEHA